MENQEKQPTDRKRKPWKKIGIIALIVIIIALLGFVLWQWKLCADGHVKDEADKKALQAKIDDLTKQLAAAKTKANTGDSSSDKSGVCTAQVALTQSLKDNIAAAITSKNTAALEGYMATAVNVVFAATEKGGNVTPAQAVTDLEYVNSGATAPWNFSLSEATINSYKAGFYATYFDGVVHVGRSANSYVVSFGFDTCGKINRIFVIPSEDLLLS